MAATVTQAVARDGPYAWIFYLFWATGLLILLRFARFRHRGTVLLEDASFPDGSSSSLS